MVLALVDADSIYFRCCFASKRKQDIRKYIRKTLTDIEGFVMAEYFDDVEMRIAVKGRGNFRNKIYPEYKKNRPQQPDDMREALTYAHEFMVNDLGAIQADGMEADDLVSIWAAEAREMEIPHTICGIDKDLKQIPGHHFNFVSHVSEWICEEDAERNLMRQALIGDNSDNIPGIRGIGPKKADKILAGVPSNRLRSRVAAAWRYHNAGSPDLSLRLLTMLTSWEELDEIQSSLRDQTTEREQDVLSEQEQDSGVSEVSAADG